MTSLWCNVSVNVVANSNWSCLLIFAPKVHLRVQPTSAKQSGIFNKMHGAVHALHMFLNNASMRTVHKCLKRNNGHLITLQIWMEWRYRVWGATHKAILKPSSAAQNSFWITSHTAEDTGQFAAGPNNKVVRSFTNVNAEKLLMEDILSIYLYSKSVCNYGICAVLNCSEFLITSQLFSCND